MKHVLRFAGIQGNKKFSIVLLLMTWAFLLPWFNQGVHAQNCTVNAGVNDSICPNQVLKLYGTSAGSYTGAGNIHWTQRSGPSVTITNPYDLNTTVTGYTSGGSYSFYLWAKCLDGTLVRDSVNVHIFDLTTADAGPDQYHCPGNGVITMAGNAPGVGQSGLWTVEGANNGVQIVSPTSPTTLINLLPGSCGITVLRWTIRGQYSCRSYDEVSITNLGGVTTVNAGPDQNIGGCYSLTTSTTLAASNGGCGYYGQSGYWTVVSGPNNPTFSNQASNTSSLSNLIQGTYTLKWTVSGSCANGSDLVVITVAPALGGVTGASAGGGQIFCDGRTTFTLTGNNPLNANETGTWLQTAGPSATINSPSTPITTVTVPPTTSGTYTFSYTILNTVTNCSSSASTSVVYNVPPTITLGGNIVLPCADSIATITYSSTGNGTIQYSIISGPTNWFYPSFPTPYADASYPTQEIYHLSKVGTYTIRFRITPGTGAACTTVSSDLTVTTSQLPESSNSGTPQILGCNITQTHLSGNIPKLDKGTGYWTAVRWPGYPGGTPATMEDPTLYNTLISNLVPGIYRFRWTISNGIACPPVISDTRVIVVNAAPTQADAGFDSTVCYGSPFVLQGNAPALNEWGYWSVTPSGPTFSNFTSARAIVNGLALNTLYTFTWHIYNACSSNSDAVNIQTTFDLGPIQAYAGPDQCVQPATTTTVQLAGNDPSPGTGMWRQIPADTPPVTITDPTSQTTTVTNLSPGTFKFEWAITHNGCGPTRDTVMITISDPVTPAYAGVSRTKCGDTIYLAGNTPLNAGEIGVWTQTSGNAGPIHRAMMSSASAWGSRITLQLVLLLKYLVSSS